MADIYKKSFEFFREPVRKYSEFFSPLQNSLRRAHITVPPEHWAGYSIFVGVLAGAVALSLVLFFGLGLGFGLPTIPIAFLLGPLIGVTGFFLTFYYPNIIADERKKKIENALPFGTLYLTTLARAGFPPQTIFRLMAGFKEYGELSHEASKISNDIDALGLDISEALSRAMKRSPSSKWTELLAGLKTAINVGGDLADFLDQKADGFVADYKRRLSEFSNFLTLMIEIYITLVIVGGIFFIVISSVMSSIGAVPVQLLKTANLLIVIIGIPALTGAFLLIAKGLSPLED
ncbi:MAG TPA: type II secretion system F family protein [Candidatus Nanoarchaeia archaeon]|nr:type II secretion system F family protein [Candidatus Nanoarchaeia archaeon]